MPEEGTWGAGVTTIPAARDSGRPGRTKLTRWRGFRKGEHSEARPYSWRLLLALLLQLPLEQFDLVGQSRVRPHKPLNLADRMQDGGVVAPAKAASNLGE